MIVFSFESVFSFDCRFFKVYL